jgi:hypothetical protein
MFVPSCLPADAFLQRAGTVPKYSAFVARGCLRRCAVDVDAARAGDDERHLRHCLVMT